MSGRADVIFSDVKGLVMDSSHSDYASGILRLKYVPSYGNVIPFSVRVYINEDDVFQVADYSSKRFFGMDLIRKDSASSIIEDARSVLQKEFEDEIVNEKNIDDLSRSEVYQAFLKKCEQMITSSSDWKSVEISFGE